MKKDLIYWAKRIYNIGASPATSGNISVLDNENNILITSSGSAAADLEENDIVKINLEGQLIEGEKKPSSEKTMHCKIYQKRPDIKAIIHSHSPEITAFAVLGEDLDEVMTPDFAYYFGEVPLCEYYLPSSGELAQEVSELFEYNNAVLMGNHGVVVGGKTLKEAFYLLETLQAYCKTYLYTEILGHREIFGSQQIKEIEKLK